MSPNLFQEGVCSEICAKAYASTQNELVETFARKGLRLLATKAAGMTADTDTVDRAVLILPNKVT